MLVTKRFGASVWATATWAILGCGSSMPASVDSAVPDLENKNPDAGTEVNKAAELKITPQIAVLPARPPVTPTAKPAVANNASEAAIRLVFDADCWTEITDKSGKILLSQLNRAGTEQRIDGQPPFALVIGHAKAAHLYYKGEAVDLAPYTNIEVARLTLK